MKFTQQELKRDILDEKIYKLDFDEFLYLYGEDIPDVNRNEYDSYKI